MTGGRRNPQPDVIVHPTTEEVARLCRIAQNYKLPLTVWGGGSGSQGGCPCTAESSWTPRSSIV